MPGDGSKRWRCAEKEAGRAFARPASTTTTAQLATSMFCEIRTHSEASISEQELREILGLQLPRVRRHWAERVRLSRIDHVIEPLVVLNQRVHQTNRVRRVHVVVFVARLEEQLALQVRCEIDVGRDVDPEHAVRGCTTRRCVRGRSAILTILRAATTAAVSTAPAAATAAPTAAPATGAAAPATGAATTSTIS